MFQHALLQLSCCNAYLHTAGLKLELIQKEDNSSAMEAPFIFHGQKSSHTPINPAH